MALAKPRPDLTAYELATRRQLTALVGELAEVLGPRLVAYIAGVGETRAVREWADGSREPRDPIPSRLRLAYRVAHLIREHDSAEVARAWFQGLNPQLDDQSPARLIRARLRPDPAVIAGLQAIEGPEPMDPVGVVPRSWLAERGMGAASVSGDFASVGHARSLAWLRARFAADVVEAGLVDLWLLA